MQLNTTAEYLGLQLTSPIVIGSSSLTRNPEDVRELAIAGAGAIVLPSLFEEQVVHQLILDGKQPRENEELVEAASYTESEDEYNGGPQEYLELITRLKGTTAIPVIASLNGCTDGRWLGIASDIEQAGADAIEITLESDVTDASLGADQVEEQMLSCVGELCDLVTIPISVKLSPFHTNLANLAWRLTEAGVTGIVCFAHDPIWEIATDRIEATMKWELTPAGCVNPTIAGLIRVRSGGPPISLAASGGISAPADLIRTILAGADVGMITSEIYRSGPDAVAHLLDGLHSYLERHGFDSFAALTQGRPKPKRSARKLRVDCLTHDQEFVDPTPRLPTQTGDRWGHLR